MPWRKRTIESFFLLVHQKQEPIRGNKSDYHFIFLFPFTLGLFLVFFTEWKGKADAIFTTRLIY